MAHSRALQRVHGGALPRSTVAPTYEGRSTQALAGKLATARAAATLLERDQVAILDGGSTALALAGEIPPDHTGTFITHSPPVAAALATRPGVETILIGGTLDPRAIVAVGARAVEGYRAVTADVLFLGVWSLHAEHGIANGYHKEAQPRSVMLECAGTVVGLASREKLGTVAPFAVGPATALTHLATDAPPDLTAPFEELGLTVVR